jgi:hypothetical protein
MPHAAITEYAPSLGKEAYDTQCRKQSRPPHDLATPRGFIRFRRVYGRVHYRASPFPSGGDERLAARPLLPLDSECKLTTLPTWIQYAPRRIECRWQSDYEADGQGAALPAVYEYTLQRPVHAVFQRGGATQRPSEAARESNKSAR